MRGVFDDLLTAHEYTPDPIARSRMENTIFGRIVDFRNAVKRRKVRPDERERIESRLHEYQQRLAG